MRHSVIFAVVLISFSVFAATPRTIVPIPLPQEPILSSGVLIGEDVWIDCVIRDRPSGKILHQESAERVFWLGDSPWLFLGASGEPLPAAVTDRTEAYMELFVDAEPKPFLTSSLYPKKNGLEPPITAEKMAAALASQNVNAGYLSQVINYMANFLPTLDIEGDSLTLNGSATMSGEVTCPSGLNSLKVGKEVYVNSSANLATFDLISARYSGASGSGYPINGYISGQGTGWAGYFLSENSNNTGGALSAWSNGTGATVSVTSAIAPALEMVILPSAGSTENAMNVANYGNASAASFITENTSNAMDTLTATNKGSGIAVSAFALGSGDAGFFLGDVVITGTHSASFSMMRVDHPEKPATHYLQHANIASSEPLNLYSGSVQLDSDGQAEIGFPSWFESLNQAPRVQLTPIGAPAPNLYAVPHKNGEGFSIAGGDPGLEVFWQVTCARKIATLPGRRGEGAFEVEPRKPDSQQGTYLQPQLHGKSLDQSVRPIPKALDPDERQGKPQVE